MIQDYPNASRGLTRVLSLIKPYHRVYAALEKSQKTVKCLKDTVLVLGYIEKDCILKREGKVVVASAINKMSGSITSKMYGERNTYEFIYLMHGKEGQRYLDVTDKFLNEVANIGACAISEGHCYLVQTSKRKKQCVYCGEISKSKVVVYKSTNWERVGRNV